VVFIEFKGKSKFEVVKTKKDPKEVRFEMRDEEDDLDESTGSYEEVEQPTSVVRGS
jgi:hypothetical protein